MIYIICTNIYDLAEHATSVSICRLPSFAATYSTAAITSLKSLICVVNISTLTTFLKSVTRRLVFVLTRLFSRFMANFISGFWL